MTPSTFTFLRRGVNQVRQHGWRLLWWRYVMRPRILTAGSIKCPDNAELEVHMQLCARDWLNALWSIRSLRRTLDSPFQLLLLCDETVTSEIQAKLRHRLPGADVMPCGSPSARVVAAFEKYPTLLRLRHDVRHRLLPKIIDTSVLRRREMVLSIDPDVVFFERPSELLADLDARRGYFGRFNLPRRDADPATAFSIDPSICRERLGLELPRRFNAGLASLNYAAAPWDEVERVFAAIPPDPERAFLTEQTIVWLLANAAGWEALPPERYVMEPVETLTGVVARHYFGDTRDLLYVEGLPALLARALHG